MGIDEMRDDIVGALMAYLNETGMYGKGGTHSYDCGDALGIISMWMGRTGWEHVWMPHSHLIPDGVLNKVHPETRFTLEWREVSDE